MSLRSRARVVLPPVVGVLALLVPGPVPSSSDVVPVVVDAGPLDCLNAEFMAYGNSGAGWTGADSTWSAVLSDGREVFAFSDTFVRPIDPPRRPDDAGFLHNSLVVRHEDGRLSTVLGGTPERPASLIEPARPDNWYWLGAPVALDGMLQIPLGEWRPTGPGPWDIEFVGSAVARISETDLRKVLSVTPLPRTRGIQWGQWVQPEGKWAYVYGVETVGPEKYVHVARVAGGDLRAPLSFWTGSRWSHSERESARIISGVHSELSVHRLRDGRYLLVTTAGDVGGFGDRVIGRFAPTPTGPFGPAATLYTTPESGASGSFADPDVYTYNAHVHPEFSTSTELVVSYNVNSLDTAPGGDVYRDVAIYRPRFVTIELTDPSGASGRPARQPCRTGR